MTPKAKRARWRRRRRIAAAMLAISPAALLVVADVVRRPDHLASFDRPHLGAYLATAVASAIFWAVLLVAAARKRGWLRDAAAGLFVTLFTLAVGVQSAFFAIYDIYYSQDATIFARSLPWVVWGYLPLAEPAIAARLVAHLLLALGMVAAARRWMRPGRWPRRAAAALMPVVLVAVTQIPASFRMWQSTTPDLIYFHGLAAHARERLGSSDDAPELRVQRRAPKPLPRLEPRPSRPRNVLLILQESLRWDVTCNAYDPRATEVDPPRCATPFSNAATPDRFALQQLRAGASTTAISISNLWSGIPPTAGFEALHTAPLLWDFAAAAGYRGAYWTSQHVMFGSMRLYVQDLPVQHRVFATHLDKQAHFDAGADDALLTDRVIADWAALEEPFFAVVHYSNVHFPYVYDPDRAPFQPAEFTKAADKNEHFLNYYKNVAYLSDIAVGRLIEHVRSTDSGARTVIVYTADHGESFREHWQLGHTSSLYDEEIKVPGWIDAPPGTLSDEEREALAAAHDQFVWHFDLHATMLDLLGLWSAPEIVPLRRHMLGQPLTRRERTVRPVPLTNCSWLWECGFRNWGMMLGHMKIEAREWDNDFHCFDLLADPEERVNLGEQACAPLPDLAREHFGEMPVQQWPRGKALVFGQNRGESAE